MGSNLPDLGDLLFGIAIVLAVLIGIFECIERRRENRREQRVLDAIEREYQAYCRAGRL
jgi:protein-S-isoprenylcysteine O-methyltransferase Ste14